MASLTSPRRIIPGKSLSDFWRRCDSNQMDMHCRDRIRMELTKSSLTLYVNGVKYMESGGWPSDVQLPDSFVNGPIYAYNMNMMNGFNSAEVVRFHWDNLAINPKDAHGNPRPPTVSPSFCLDQPNSTCPMVFVAPDLPVPSKDSVDILDFVYGTPVITIAAGETVTWTNKTASSLAHTVTSATGAFDSGPIRPNGTFSHTFDAAGTYEYYCTPHPGMTGKVVVLPADAAEHH